MSNNERGGGDSIPRRSGLTASVHPLALSSSMCAIQLSKSARQIKRMMKGLGQMWNRNVVQSGMLPRQF